MVSVLAVVLPIFALVLAGWGVRRAGVLGEHATRELNRFVVWLALPALLFDIVANARWSEVWRPGFVAAFGLGAGVVFAATVLVRRRGGRPLADAAIDGLNGAYANTGYMGFPLALAAFGPQALTPTLIATLITVCVVFAAALVLIEIGRSSPDHGHGQGRRMLAAVAASLARNPLLVAPVAGGLCMAFGLKPPPVAESFLKLLGAAASPCALVALGLFLAEDRASSGTGPERARIAAPAAALTAVKLVAHPAATWFFATQVFRLEPALARTAVLLAALPTGTGPFMVAEYYGREAALTARTVLLSTVISLATLTALLLA